jgi:hypothetical protein
MKFNNVELALKKIKQGKRTGQHRKQNTWEGSKVGFPSPSVQPCRLANYIIRCQFVVLWF